MGICRASERRVRVDVEEQIKTVRESGNYQTDYRTSIHEKPRSASNYAVIEVGGSFLLHGRSKIYPYCQIDNYTIFSPPLGSGASSTVYICRESETQNVYAIKVVDSGKFFKMTCKLEYMGRNAFDREIAILKLVDFPYLIKLYEVFEFPQDGLLFLLFTYIDGGSITYSNSADQYPLSKVKRYMTQLLLAINYLHDNHIIHRDIKVENLLLDKTHDNIILCDFGLSHIYQTNDMVETICGTRYYISPEMISSKKKTFSGKACDLWAAGIVMYRLIYGQLPFKGTTVRNTNIMILKSSLLLPFRVDDDSCLVLLFSLLDKNPKRRVTASEAFHMDFISKNNELLENKIEINNINDVKYDPSQPQIKPISFFTISLIKLKMTRKVARCRDNLRGVRRCTNPTTRRNSDCYDQEEDVDINNYHHDLFKNFHQQNRNKRLFGSEFQPYSRDISNQPSYFDYFE